MDYDLDSETRMALHQERERRLQRQRAVWSRLVWPLLQTLAVVLAVTALRLAAPH